MFTGAGVKTVVLFFDKGSSTKKIWYYQLNLDRNLGKTNPLNENDLADFVKLQKTKADSENSWTVNISDVVLRQAQDASFDLSVKNPHRKTDSTLRAPAAILAEMKSLDDESAKILKSIEKML